MVEGPAGLDPLASLVIAGVSAALLCGLAVALIAPGRFTPRLGIALAIAGAVGGVVFDLKLAFDPHLLIGHAAWQLLVFLALYFRAGPRGAERYFIVGMMNSAPFEPSGHRAVTVFSRV